MPTERHNIDELLRYLFAGRAGVEVRFDGLYKERIDATYVEVLRLFNMLQNASDNSIEDGISEGSANAILILWKSIKTLLAGLQLLRAGYWDEACSLLRDVLETTAVGLHLHLVPDDLSEFRAHRGKQLYNNALNTARRIVPSVLGERKLLSEIYVHPSGFDGVIEWNGDKFSMVGVFDESELHRYENTMLHLEIVLMEAGKIIEFVFFDYASSPRFWKRVDADKLEEKEIGRDLLDKIIATAEITKKGTGIDWLTDAPDDDERMRAYKALLRRYRERKQT